MKKQTLKSLIIKLSKENSLITQFTSFVAVEKRVCIFNSWSFYLYLCVKKMTLAFTDTGGPCIHRPLIHAEHRAHVISAWVTCAVILML